MSEYILVIFVFILCIISLVNKVNAYNAFVDGVIEALKLFVTVFPALLAMLFCVELLSISHLFEYLAEFINNFNTKIPSEIIPMSMFRPISGNASLAILIKIFENQGPDSLVGIMSSVIQGATDTTFYVISLYYGTIGVKKIRHTMWVSLLCDFSAIVLAIFLTIKIFG